MPSGTTALAVPPPATPVRPSQPVDGIDNYAIPASPGCAPKLHMHVPGTFLSQKAARVTFAADAPKLPTSGQPADSNASAASAAAEVIEPAAGFPVVLSRSVWDVPHDSPVLVPPTESFRSSSVFACSDKGGNCTCKVKSCNIHLYRPGKQSGS